MVILGGIVSQKAKASTLEKGIEEEVDWSMHKEAYLP
jgi:hypothetical protein